MTISEIPPRKPQNGDLWYSTGAGRLYTWSAFHECWVLLGEELHTVLTKEQFEKWAMKVITDGY